MQPNPETADTTEAQVQDEDVVDTMEDDFLEAMERENCKICDSSDYIFGGGIKQMMKLNLCLMP